MDVKIAEFKNGLSGFLRRIAQTKETITILDRNRPVAQVVPLSDDEPDSSWKRESEALLDRAKKMGIKLRLPKKRPPPLHSLIPKPRVAPDGRIDISSVDAMRKGKDY